MQKVSWMSALVFATAAVVAAQTGPAGKWTGETQGRQGPQPITLELRVAGTALTGTLAQGPAPAAELKNGKIVDASTISFTVERAGRGGDPIMINYTGKIAGDDLTLTVELPAGGGGGGGGGRAGGGAGGGGGRGGGGPITLKRSK